VLQEVQKVWQALQRVPASVKPSAAFDLHQKKSRVQVSPDPAFTLLRRLAEAG
jgi:hypothetical protein